MGFIVNKLPQSLRVRLLTLIVDRSDKYGIDPTWIPAIITHESSWNPYAMKYESSYQWLYECETSAKAARVSLATEIATQKISWGLGQIMGALAREQGWKGALSELTQPELNIEHMAIRLAYLKGLSPEKDDVFASYNGGPGALRKINGVYMNQKYVDTVNGYLPKESV